MKQFTKGLSVMAMVLQCGAALGGTVPVSFNKDIRPILSDKCYHCHGFDEKERKAGLRLDVREAALKGGDGGPAIVPGKPDEGELMKRILTTDADEIMPPPKMHKPISKAEAGLLRQWIAEGAEYQGHWAFLEPQRPAAPGITAHGVDDFIQQSLQRAGLKPSQEASKEELLRRVTLDLTGLPPSQEERRAFLNDADPRAYEKLVDRLLASPRYGEHMAANWLDMSRYADSNGFQSDTSRQMWPWRDWLIRSLNANLPFDEFTIQQMAGDLLPNATPDQITATGFHRNHRLNGEGGRIVEEWFAETVIDRLETTGLTWMALTWNCCRCHDHKYDPLSQKEFYQFFAYFNSGNESGVLEDFGGAAGTRKGGNTKPVLDLPTPEQADALAKAMAAIKAAETQVASLKASAKQRQKQAEGAVADMAKMAWQVGTEAQVSSQGGATLAKQADGSWLASGKLPALDIYEITMATALPEVTGLLLECLPDASLPAQSVGRNENGNFVLSAVELDVLPPNGGPDVEGHFARVEADYEQKNWEISNLLPKKGEAKEKRKGKGKRNDTAGGKGWAVDGNSRKEASKALFVLAEPLKLSGGKVKVTLRHEALNNHAIGRFRISLSGAPTKELVLNPATTDAALQEAEAALAAAKKHLGEVDKDIVSTMVLQEAPTPKQAYVLNRGEYDKIGEKVERALPKALPPMPAEFPNNRLGLAKWLVSGTHPLTARVWVNRAWERFFGMGIVKSSENFGSQADWPSHPELLDWLATEFVRLKWDMKAMHRLLVTSHTYKQSAKVQDVHLQKDPDNKLLSRAPRLRLGGEALRDQALFLSGLLVEKIGGPSVKPYMPAAVWDETSVYGDMRNYKEDTGEGLYRRTVYTIWKRTAAPPSMLLFDSPSREICTVKRSRSNTPTQALALLNEVTYLESARKFAERMMLEGGATAESRITWGFEQAAGRKPEAGELARLLEGLQRRILRYAGDEKSAAALLQTGKSPVAKSLDPKELAAYTITANVLLNLDEVVTRG